MTYKLTKQLPESHPVANLLDDLSPNLPLNHRLHLKFFNQYKQPFQTFGRLDSYGFFRPSLMKQTQKRLCLNLETCSVTGPWCRLPLTVRWLRPELKGNVDFQPDRPPPMHMPIVYGPVKSINLKKKLKSKAKKKSKEAGASSQAEVWKLFGPFKSLKPGPVSSSA